MSSVHQDGFSLVTYPPDQIPWFEVKPFIKMAIEEYTGDDPLDLDEIYDGLRVGKYQLWTCQSDAIDAVVLTAIEGKACRIVTAGGSYMSIWVDWLPCVEKFAKQHGCEELIVYGRIGWARAAGFNVLYTKMSRKI